MRKFYLGYKNLQTLSAELSWSHYVELIGTEEELSDYGYIAVESIEKDPANGRPSFKVRISENGRKFLEQVQK
jgi:hypothetical protein